MKKYLILLLLTFMICFHAKSQTVQALPPPDAGYGYLGTSIVYNNSLYSLYRDVNHGSRLAQINSSNNVTLIPNPDAGGVGFNSDGIIFNNKLYFQYGNANGVWQLAQFDGSNVTLIPNPDNSTSGYMGSPIIFNGALYLQYLNNASIFQLAKFDGTTISLIANPDSVRNTGYLGWPIVYNGNLYLKYLSNTTTYLAKFDGTTISLISNVPGGSYGNTNYIGSEQPYPIVYNNKLCFYYSLNTDTYLAEFDGSSISVIPNPTANANGYENSPIIYNNKLYTEYYDTNNGHQLAQFDGTTLSIVGGTTNALGTSPMIYNCDLYFYGPNELNKYDGSTINPVFASFPVYPAKYNGDLYFSTTTGGLAQYDGTTVTTISNPSGSNDYQANSVPIVYNNNLYLLYYTNTGVMMGYLTNSATNVLPTVVINASSNNICSGQTVTYTAVTTNTGINPSYQWQVNGMDVGTNTSTFQSSSLLNGDSVSCILTTYDNCSSSNIKSNIIIMKINPIVTPAVSISSPNNNICSGSSITFTASSVNGGSNPFYQWQVNGINVGTNNLTYTSSSLSNGDVVNCILTSNSACTSTTKDTSNNLSVIINPMIVSSVNISSDTNNICYNTPVTFIAHPMNGGATPMYQWQVDGNLVGNNSNTYTNSSLQNGSIVSCILTSSIGCTQPVTSANMISMVVYPLPTIGQDTDKVIPYGTSTILNLSFTGNIDTYLWQPAISLNNAAIANPIASPLTTTTYTVNVTTINGCKASGDITVNVFIKLLMPNAFSPNGDGTDDVFRIPPSIPIQINRFSIYNRWGNMVFTTGDAAKGWDGNYQGQPQSMDTYVWVIQYRNSLTGMLENQKGTVVLIR